jgi:uncharacterized SAM-binding protein YcdF (DUF218 family)
MLVTLKMLLHTLLLPPALPLLLAGIGAWLIGRRAGGTARTGWVLLVIGLGALWLLSLPVVADALTRAAQRYPPLDLTRAAQAQAIVVLGGYGERATAPEFGGEPAAAAALLERITYTGFIAEHTHLPVLVSGTPEETAAMRASLARGFHIDVRWVEPRSRDTFENARFSAALLRAAGVTRIVLVTDGDHEWRAAHEFSAAGFSVLPAPEGLWAPRRPSVFTYLPSPRALTRSSEALYELLGDLTRRALAALDLRRQSP